MIGGIYGIGGGSLLGPILAARGMPMARIAPATLAVTFTTSVAGAAAYAVLAAASSGPVVPDWWLGLACGFGGYLRGHLQPRLPETFLRLLLGTLATVLCVQQLCRNSTSISSPPAPRTARSVRSFTHRLLRKS
ncbi:TSUP family transporter [Streptomyces sp. NPDC046182]|uniref:TSUP family transporter n=1 Tax=Streptomyces sp. NPDC046182 TaxID=3154601 RepID=UPI0033D9F5B9